MNLKQWWTRLRSRSMREVMRHKHKFVVMDTNTFKEKFSFELTGSHLFVALGIAVIVSILLDGKGKKKPAVTTTEEA